MQVIRELQTYTKPNRRVCATLGSFDGIHLGHQALLHALIKEAGLGGETFVFSFSNHPTELFHPDSPTPTLTNEFQKVALIENLGISTLLLHPFTYDFSQQTAREFLTSFYQYVGFDLLLLGYNARLGNKRSGSPEELYSLANEIGFTLKYFPEYKVDDQPISSTYIRSLISIGHLEQAKILLSKSYSLQGKVMSGQQIGTTMGYPTANLSLERYCLPPFGVYAISSYINGQSHFGVANIGIAPTLKNLSKPILEVYFFQPISFTSGDALEVTLYEFLRPEIHFNDQNELSNQIGKDIANARALFSNHPDYSI